MSRASTPTSGDQDMYSLGLAAGTLRFQRCMACDAAQTLRRYACSACGSAQLSWRDSRGAGTVYACSVVHLAPSDRYRALVPYTLVLVDLDEGFRLMAHAEPGIRIGDRVAAGFFTHEGLHLVRFRHAPPRDLDHPAASATPP